jgi:formylglycine-generating enzyme required for sulfatase activity
VAGTLEGDLGAIDSAADVDEPAPMDLDLDDAFGAVDAPPMPASPEDGPVVAGELGGDLADDDDVDLDAVGDFDVDLDADDDLVDTLPSDAPELDPDAPALEGDVAEDVRATAGGPVAVPDFSLEGDIGGGDVFLGDIDGELEGDVAEAEAGAYAEGGPGADGYGGDDPATQVAGYDEPGGDTLGDTDAPGAGEEAATVATPPAEEETDVDLQVQTRAREEQTDQSLSGHGAMVGRGGEDFRRSRRTAAGLLAMILGLLVLVGVVLYTVDLTLNDGATIDSAVLSAQKLLKQSTEVQEGGDLPPDVVKVKAEVEAAIREDRFDDARDLVGDLRADTDRAAGLVTVLDHWVRRIEARFNARIVELEAELNDIRSDLESSAPSAFDGLRDRFETMRRENARLLQQARLRALVDEIEQVLASGGEIDRPLVPEPEIAQNIKRLLQMEFADVGAWAEGRDEFETGVRTIRSDISRLADPDESAYNRLTPTGRRLSSLVSNLSEGFAAYGDGAYESAVETLTVARTTLRAIRDTTYDDDATPFSDIEFPWVDAIIAKVRGDWSDSLLADVAAATQLLLKRRADITPGTKGTWIRDAQAGCEQYDETLDRAVAEAPAQRRDEISAEAAQLRETVAGIRELADNLTRYDRNMSALRFELGKPAGTDWARVKESAEAVLRAIREAAVGVESDRELAHTALMQADWNLLYRRAELAYRSAVRLQSAGDFTPETGAQQWAECATIYTQLLDLLFGDDGLPQAHTIDPKLTPSQRYEPWNRVIRRSTYAPAMRDYWISRQRFDAAVARWQGAADAGDRAAIAAEFAAARDLAASAWEVLRRRPDRSDFSDEIARASALVFRAAHEAEWLTTEDRYVAAQELVAQGQLPEAIREFDSLSAEYSRFGRLYAGKDADRAGVAQRRIGEVAQLRDQTQRRYEREKVARAVADGSRDESALRRVLGSANPDIAAARSTLSTMISRYRDALPDAPAGATQRLIQTRLDRLAAVAPLLDAIAAERAGDAATARQAAARAISRAADQTVAAAARRVQFRVSLADRQRANREAMESVAGSGSEAFLVHLDAGRTPPERVADFFVDRTEVTNGEYRQFVEWLASVGHNDADVRHPEQPADIDPSHTPRVWNLRSEGFDALPVVGVTYWNAYAFAKWAGKRLPTAAEWEWLARNRDAATPFPWTGEPEQIPAVYAGNRSGTGTFFAPAPAATESGANTLGVLNLAGNVREWTETRAGLAAGIVKGGSAISPLPKLRADSVDVLPLGYYDDVTGFRCAMDVPATDG